MIARLEVTRGTLTEYPLAEKTRGGWQNGVTFYPDAEVTKVTPLHVLPAEPQGEPPYEVPEPSEDRDEITDAALWDFAGDLLDAWNIEDTNAPSLSEDFRDRFVARFHPAYRAEPQGEPSDALPLWERPEAVEAARLAYQEAFDADYDAEDCITAALRAAGGAR